MKYRWNRTLMNLCGIVAAISKMSGHHYLPTYQILMISDNVEFLRPFWKWRPLEIFQCRESIRDIIITHISNLDDIGQCWIFAVLWRPFWKWRLVEIFQCGESIRDIIIYPHIKFWWYRKMLNFYRPYFMPCFENAELLL